MARAKRRSEADEYRSAVETYVAAGGDESVQRVVTAVHRLSRRLNQWYDRQLADLDISAGEWAVISELARMTDGGIATPSALASAVNVAPSSMTHRLDRMVERGWLTREADPDNRTRVLIRLSDEGRQLFVVAIQEANLVEADVVAALSERQLKELGGLLERLIHGLDESEI